MDTHITYRPLRTLERQCVESATAGGGSGKEMRIVTGPDRMIEALANGISS